MGNYTNMAAHYDFIMTSGYYDYEKIVNDLLQYAPFRSILEIGCGTGLILNEIAKRNIIECIAGVDLTEAMLSIASKRLREHSNVSLMLQNVVHMELRQNYDVAFSYGGVWYFVVDNVSDPFLVSHVVDDADNERGFSRLACCVRSGGTLLLGKQGPHFDYSKPLAGGSTYSQRITPCPNGFIKDYYLANATETVMSQTLRYRTYSFAQSLDLLAKYGFEFRRSDDTKLFMEFRKS